MLLLALFYAGPRVSCACAQKVVVAAPAGKEHDCCKEKSVAPCLSSQAQLSEAKGCCGMMGTASPAVASSIQLIGSPELERIKAFSPFVGNAVEQLVYPGLSGNMNRAPPRIVGFGTSKTYLFKRTLLI